MAASTGPRPNTPAKSGRSRLQRIAAESRAAARAAEAELADALRQAGLVLPSLATEHQADYFTGIVLVDLGRARPDVVSRLAALVRRGVAAAESGP
ncbi:hypothetical protein GCM10010430_29280 [Kitasatospora cystarginea]|uniref:Uncharacterized protein n=1 Tax=Kitasatospora cystarginea TaxID=58350 RepID=A0ABN3E0A1_9ACTN